MRGRLMQWIAALYVHGSSGARVVTLVLVAWLTGSCCEEPTKPCMPWAVEGETYTIEVRERFDNRYDGDPYTPLPYGRYPTERPCGDSLDLAPGSMLSLRPTNRVDGDGRTACTGGCYYLDAEVEIDGVVRTNDLPDGRHVGNHELSTRFGANIRENCSAGYTIGIAQVAEHFIQESDQGVSTGHMLYREIVGELPDCVTPGSEIEIEGRCWDTWAVRIWDSKGNLITKDLPPRAAIDGGGSGTTENDDGGPDGGA
jgi:hypothetical protein